MKLKPGEDWGFLCLASLRARSSNQGAPLAESP